MNDRLRHPSRIVRSLLSSTLAAAFACATTPSEPAEPYSDLLSCATPDSAPTLVPTPFGGAGDVMIEPDRIVIGMGSPLTGIQVPNFPAREDYELDVVAARTGGNDFFCGLTFPVGDAHLTLVIGGWGGALCGVSSLDGADASQNETKSFQRLERNRPYAIHVSVRRNHVTATLDGAQLVDVPLASRQLSVRPEMLPSTPLGIATYNTTAVISRFRWRPIRMPPQNPKRLLCSDRSSVR